MGKKSGLAPHALAALGGSGRRLTRGRLLTFLLVGFGVGLTLGFIFMGTMHAVSPAGTQVDGLAGLDRHAGKRCPRVRMPCCASL